jgi:hypothetical protein
VPGSQAPVFSGIKNAFISQQPENNTVITARNNKANNGFFIHPPSEFFSQAIT